MPPLLTLASRIPRNIAAADALRSIVLSVQEDGAYLLIAELTKVRALAVVYIAYILPWNLPANLDLAYPGALRMPQGGVQQHDWAH